MNWLNQNLSLHLNKASRSGTGVWRATIARESRTCSQAGSDGRRYCPSYREPATKKSFNRKNESEEEEEYDEVMKTYLSLSGFDTTSCEREEALKKSVDDQLGSTSCLHFNSRFYKTIRFFIIRKMIVMMIQFIIIFYSFNFKIMNEGLMRVWELESGEGGGSNWKVNLKLFFLFLFMGNGNWKPALALMTVNLI